MSAKLFLIELPELTADAPPPTLPHSFKTVSSTAGASLSVSQGRKLGAIPVERCEAGSWMAQWILSIFGPRKEMWPFFWEATMQYRKINLAQVYHRSALNHGLGTDGAVVYFVAWFPTNILLWGLMNQMTTGIVVTRSKGGMSPGYQSIAKLGSSYLEARVIWWWILQLMAGIQHDSCKMLSLMVDLESEGYK